MLVASRLTSHSQGPGTVSSKSLMSKTRCRSGEANAPKFDRWASPQSCTFSPDRGVAPGRSPWAAPRHGRRRTPRTPCARSGSAAAPARAWRPGLCSRVSGSLAVRSGDELRVAGPRHLRSGRLAPRDSLFPGGSASARRSLGVRARGRDRRRHRRSFSESGHVAPADDVAVAVDADGCAATLAKPAVRGILRTGRASASHGVSAGRIGAVRLRSAPPASVAPTRRRRRLPAACPPAPWTGWWTPGSLRSP